MNLYNPTSNPATNLIWIDCEFTGLNIETDKIIEIAVLITNSNLEVIEELEPLTIHQPQEILSLMSTSVKDMHTKNGLLDRVRNSKLTIQDAEDTIITFVKKHCVENSSPMCGNSIYEDRIFIKKQMPKLDTFLHYHLLDVTALKELYRLWKPEKPKFEKKETHEAKDDIHESLKELLFYRENLIKLN